MSYRTKRRFGYLASPAGSSTVLSFEIPSPGAVVTITIYDVRGRRVRVLVDEHREAGFYSEAWDLTSDNGGNIAPGVYFCRMEAGTFRETKKLVVLR